jgi:hypothetical protein
MARALMAAELNRRKQVAAFLSSPDCSSQEGFGILEAATGFPGYGLTAFGWK